MINTNIQKSIVADVDKHIVNAINNEQIIKLENAIWLLDNLIINNKLPIRLINEIQELIIYLPYCIHETKQENKYILVNRQYTPIGCKPHMANYDEFPNHLVILTIKELESLGLTSENTFWYGGSDAPFQSIEKAKSYLNKIEKLINIIKQQNFEQCLH